MKVKKHICFSEARDVQLVSYLNNQGIAYDHASHISTLDIYDNDPHWPFISQYVQTNSLMCLSETAFSQKELSSAEWLTVRSKWRNGYPQPENAFKYEQITYSSTQYCSECGAGLVQNNPFRIKQPPKWGNRHFMMLNWVEDELFVDKVVKELFLEKGITGVLFQKVQDKHGTQTVELIDQLLITHVLQPGILVNESIDKVMLCPNCKTLKYHPSGIGAHAFHREIFEGVPDIVKTAEVFGWGHSAPRVILVNQKTYQLIIQNKLDRGLVFEPVLLV